MVTFKDKTPKKDNNQGMHTYEGSEVANIGLGQNGFDVIYQAADFVEEDAALSATCVGNWTRGWVAFKAVGGEVDVQAESNVGNHFTDDAATPDLATGNEITVADTDVVYGNFKKIYVESLVGVLLCYRG